jgi:signal peptidase I
VLTELAITILAALALSALARAYAFQTFWIPSASMTPTLGVYDRILVQKAFFTWREVREGDIVVFSHPPLDRCSGPQDDLVKRVIALPGQTIYSAGNTIYIDGRPLAEPYLPKYDPLGPPIPNATSQHPYRVPPGEFYMMGDDRANSCDSRYWGPIKGSSIIGKAVLDIWRNGHPNFQTLLPNVTSLLALFPRPVAQPQRAPPQPKMSLPVTTMMRPRYAALAGIDANEPLADQ